MSATLSDVAANKEDSGKPPLIPDTAASIAPQILQATMVDTGGSTSQATPTIQSIVTSGTQVVAQQLPQVGATTIIAKPLEHGNKITMKPTISANIVSSAEYGKLVRLNQNHAFKIS